MATRSFMPRWLVCTTALALGLVTIGSPAVAVPPATCSEVILVLDESGSVDPHEGTVRSAIHAFLTALTDVGVDSAVVEFGTAAKTVFGYTPITAANVVGIFDPYVDASGAGDVYNPPSQLGAYTNWDDALDEVSQINATSGVAPLVLFLTDGDPTSYNLDQAGESGGVFVGGVTTEGVVRAVAEADEIRAQGSHIVAVGVGNALTSAASVDRLKQVAGPDVYTSGTLDLDLIDTVLVPDFADLPAAMALIAQAMCADPAISVEKSVNLPIVTAGSTVTYQVVVTNTGNVPLHDVAVTDPAVPGCSSVIGDLAVGESITITCDAAVWAPLTNTASGSGSDPFGTPVLDEDTAEVGLIATGTGTPGFWKNHPEVWPVAGTEVLVGDWNHNWTCDPTETCLALTTEEAMAALSTPPRGDMTWNLGRPLVAAWLNVSAGNDPSCVADTIDAAVGWLLAHPLGSGVGGGDPAWGDASNWAGTLDDYNNGQLCAEHRDAVDNDIGASIDGEEAAVVMTPSPSSQAESSNNHAGQDQDGQGASKQGPPNGKGQGPRDP
jgi:uncharacterized repeat protein (TIGR01451 family)